MTESPKLLLNQDHYNDSGTLTDIDALVGYRLVVVAPFHGMDHHTIGRAIERRADRGRDTIILVPHGSQEHAHGFFQAVGWREFSGNFGDRWQGPWSVGMTVAGNSPSFVELASRYRPRHWWPKELPGDLLASVVRDTGDVAGALASRVEHRHAHLYLMVLDGPPEEVVEKVAGLYAAELSRSEVPDFGDDALVTGEAELLDPIDQSERGLAEARAGLGEIRRWRSLIGYSEGAAYTAEVVRALDLVLNDHGWASDPGFIDENREDFVLGSTHPGRSARIIGNAKSVNSGVRNSHITQGHSHRQEVEEEAQEGNDDSEAAFSALVVINQFRLSNSLDRRREDIATPTLEEARRNGVAVLRSWDLFQLVNRHLAGESLPEALVDRWLTEGGWLRVDISGVELKEP